MDDIGRFALLLALVGAVYTVGAALISVRRRDERYLRSAENGVLGLAGLLSLSSIVLVNALVERDFSLRYVAEHTGRDLLA